MEVDYKVWTYAELVTLEKLAASSLRKFVYQLLKGIPKLLPSDFTWVSLIKCYLQNLLGPRRLIPKLELTNSKALFADIIPPKVSIPAPSIEEIKQR